MSLCSSCGEQNPERARFCWSCGAALSGQATAKPEVRKTVTIVFCDVTGSTALGDRLDPESLQGVMARYYERMRQVVERHGGTVAKFIGDAVVAVFGVPTLHEDDPVRALRAAAETFGPHPSGIQWFAAGAPDWSGLGPRRVRDDVREYRVDYLGDPAAVLVVDETGDLKKDTGKDLRTHLADLGVLAYVLLLRPGS